MENWLEKPDLIFPLTLVQNRFWREKWGEPGLPELRFRHRAMLLVGPALGTQLEGRGVRETGSKAPPPQRCNGLLHKIPSTQNSTIPVNHSSA